MPRPLPTPYGEFSVPWSPYHDSPVIVKSILDYLFSCQPMLLDSGSQLCFVRCWHAK